MVHISAPRTQVHSNIHERLFTGDRKEECYIGPFCFFLTLLERTFFSVSSLFFSIYLKERQLSIRIGSFPAVCPSSRVSRGTNKRGDSLLTWTRAFLGGPKIQFSMESGALGKLTICKERQRRRSSGTTCTHLDPRYSGWPKSSFDGVASTINN